MEYSSGKLTKIKPKRIVLWSGGLDSTYLIQKSLEDGYDVEAYYVNIHNNEDKSKIELAAIKKIIPFFETQSFRYNGELINITMHGILDGIVFKQAPIWLFASLYVNPAKTDEIAIGYVMNDDAVSFLNEFQKIWKSFAPIINGKLPKLVFPLSKTNKDDIICRLNPKIIDLTWTCEFPTKDNLPCGTCVACSRRKRIANGKYGMVEAEKIKFDEEQSKLQKEKSELQEEAKDILKEAEELKEELKELKPEECQVTPSFPRQIDLPLTDCDGSGIF